MNKRWRKVSKKSGAERFFVFFRTPFDCTMINLFLTVGTMRILGVDPGLRHMGWGIVQRIDGVPKAIGYGTISPPPGTHLGGQFVYLAAAFEGVLRDYGPERVALENVFLSRVCGRGSVQGAFRLGQVHGIVWFLCARAGLSVVGYAPAQVKKSIVGHGRATKEQVKFLVGRHFSDQRVSPRTTHEADALALALLHFYQAEEGSRWP